MKKWRVYQVHDEDKVFGKIRILLEYDGPDSVTEITVPAHENTNADSVAFGICQVLNADLLNAK